MQLVALLVMVNLELLVQQIQEMVEGVLVKHTQVVPVEVV
tara:strand:+ start:510 stop:629 length:120 start_codon:yes stop_codon:yes gene_type:complete